VIDGYTAIRSQSILPAWRDPGATPTGTENVAASLAVLAGIAASDASCCAALGRRPREQDHLDVRKPPNRPR
jgi:hypothetical protein